MNTQGPFSLTVAQVLPLTDPGANSNNPATAVQLQNASPFILEVNAGGLIITIQSFTAQTIPYGQIGGQPLAVNPLPSGPLGQKTATNALTVVWLLAGESSPMIDGPLTAAAITSGITSAGLAGVSVMAATETVASGATVPFATGSLAVGTYQLWNLGFLNGTPTKGCMFFNFDAGGVPAFDAVGYADFASNRLAGMRFFQNPIAFTVQVTNETDVSLTAFLTFSDS